MSHSTKTGVTERPCTALAKRSDIPLQYLHASAHYVAGHEYRRGLDWHCSRCGQPWIRGALASQISPCSVARPSQEPEA